MSSKTRLTPLEAAFRKLEEARETGDDSRVAQALVIHSASLGDLGYYAEARAALDEAAALHRQMAHPIDEAMCMQYAAKMSRLAGDLEGAHSRAAYSLQVIPTDHALRVPGFIELGEIAMLARDGVEAAQHFTNAIEAARVLQRPDLDYKHPLNRRARAFMLAGMHEDALADLDTLQRVLVAEDDLLTAAKFALDASTLLHMLGRNADAHRRSDDALTWAEESHSPYTMADISLLKAALAVDDNNLEAALNAALHARYYALKSAASHFYVAAALSICELYDLLGDRFASYEALAVGYATLQDLLGEEVSKDAFEPTLLAKREQWGADDFDAIKAEYEVIRRKKLQKKRH